MCFVSAVSLSLPDHLSHLLSHCPASHVTAGAWLHAAARCAPTAKLPATAPCFTPPSLPLAMLPLFSTVNVEASVATCRHRTHSACSLPCATCCLTFICNPIASSAAPCNTASEAAERGEARSGATSREGERELSAHMALKKSFSGGKDAGAERQPAGLPDM